MLKSPLTSLSIFIEFKGVQPWKVFFQEFEAGFEIHGFGSKGISLHESAERLHGRSFAHYEFQR